MVTRIKTMVVGAFLAAMLAVGVGVAYADDCGCSGSACGGCTISMGGCEECWTNCANCEVYGIDCQWTSWVCVSD